MKTIQMTIDEPLLAQLDQAASEEQTTRSAFIRRAVDDLIRRRRAQTLERQHRDAYAKQPATKDELAVWQEEQHWGEL